MNKNHEPKSTHLHIQLLLLKLSDEKISMLCREMRQQPKDTEHTQNINKTEGGRTKQKGDQEQQNSKFISCPKYF